MPHTRSILLLFVLLAAAVTVRAEDPPAPGKDAEAGQAGANGAKKEEAKKEEKKIPRDPDALAFLKHVMESDPGWDKDFAGFSAGIEVYWKGATYPGKVAVRKGRKAEVELPDSEALPWVEGVLASIVSHGFREDFDKQYADRGVTFGKDDLNPLGQLLLVHGGRFETRYRVQNEQVRRLNRANGDRRVTIDILDLETDQDGRKLSQIFTVNHFDLKQAALVKNETVRERKVRMGGHLLPGSYIEIVSQGQGPQTRSIRFFDHSLLEASGGGKAKNEQQGARKD